MAKTHATLFSGVLLLAALVLVPAVSGLAGEPRIALIIGNGAYKESPLANPPKDATLMAQSLTKVGFVPILLVDADQKQMKRGIQEFGTKLEEAGKDAVGLFYFAGHGVEVGGRNYLIPVGAAIARESDMEIEAVGASWVLAQMEAAGNRLNMMILDACRNNPFKRSFRAASSGLARMDAPRGTLIAYATAPGSVASDGEEANSPYTKSLSDKLATAGMPVELVFKEVRKDVLAKTGNQQTPWEASSLTGEFYFFGPVNVTIVPPSAAPVAKDSGQEAELIFWQSVMGSPNPAMFAEYLRQYPEGRFAAVAKLRMEELAAQAKQSQSKQPATAEEKAQQAQAKGQARPDGKQHKAGQGPEAKPQSVLAAIEPQKSGPAASPPEPAGPGGSAGSARPAETAKPSGAYRMGAAVDINWKGTWYPGVILEAKASLFLIHYDGYSNSWDEWVGPDRLRPRGGGEEPKERSTQAASGKTAFKAGDAVMVHWGTRWYDARVLKAQGGKYFITYDGYGSNWDEWVGTGRIKSR